MLTVYDAPAGSWMSDHGRGLFPGMVQISAPLDALQFFAEMVKGFLINLKWALYFRNIHF